MRINDRAVEAPYDYHTPLEIEKRAHLSAAVTVRVDDAIAVGQLLDDDPRPDKIDWTADITFTDYYVGVFKSPVVHWAKVRYRGEPVGVGTHQLQLHRADAAAETSHPAPD